MLTVSGYDQLWWTPWQRYRQSNSPRPDKGDRNCKSTKEQGSSLENFLASLFEFYILIITRNYALLNIKNIPYIYLAPVLSESWFDIILFDEITW